MINEEFESSPVLRFFFGAALGGLAIEVFLLHGHVPWWVCVVIPLIVGALAFFVGDRLLIMVMKLMRGLG